MGMQAPAGWAAALLLLSGPAMAGPLDKAKGAVDPDCTVTKAVVGMRSNRRDVAETTGRRAQCPPREGGTT